MGKKITQLATITEIADDDLLVGVDISDTSGSAEGTNKKFTKANLLSGLAPLDPQLTGWNPDTETWAYHSVDDPTGYIKIEDKDVSANYSVGWRIMFTNGGNVIKGIITAITYSDPDTIITFLHEIDPTDNQALYLLTNSAITENYFSPHKAPLGFPMSPVKWTVETLDTSRRQQASPSSLTWYNLGTTNCQLSIPIGAWEVLFEVWVGASGGASASEIGVSATLSTTNNSEVSKRYTASSYMRYLAHGGGGTAYNAYLCRNFRLELASKTLYYLNGSTYAAPAPTDLSFYGNENTTVIRATCAYL